MESVLELAMLLVCVANVEVNECSLLDALMIFIEGESEIRGNRRDPAARSVFGLSKRLAYALTDLIGSATTKVGGEALGLFCSLVSCIFF